MDNAVRENKFRISECLFIDYMKVIPKKVNKKKIKKERKDFVQKKARIKKEIA